MFGRRHRRRIYSIVEDRADLSVLPIIEEDPLAAWDRAVEESRAGVADPETPASEPSPGDRGR